MDARQLLRWFCLPFGVMALVSGCVTPDPSVDLLEGELRWMEDQLYMLEDELQQKCDQLTACRQGSAQDRQQPTPAQPWHVPQLDSGTDAETLPRPRSSVPEIIRSPDEPTSAASPSNDTDNQQSNSKSGEPELLPDKIDEFDLGAPEIELPEPEAIRGERPQFETPPMPSPLDAESPADTESGSAEFQVTPLLLGKAVHHIKLNAQRHSSHDKISDRDEEKLLVVVEPLSEQNEYIELSAPMTVSIEDADKEGLSASLGRWEFNALQTGRTLRESTMGRGIHLALDWPSDLTLVDNLRVFVTYTTLDGTHLEAEDLLHPKSQTTSVAGWTPVAKSRSQTVIEQPKSDPFMLTEKQQTQSVGSVFKTVPIPNKVIPASNTAQTSPVGHEANAESPRQLDATGFQSDRFEETAVDEPLAPQPINATRNDEQVARPLWQPYR